MWPARGKLSLLLALLQLAFIVLFALFVEYDDQGHARRYVASGGEGTDLRHYYPFFQDVHVMIFVGFGFLMTFLKKYCFGAVGFNFLLAALVIQWATLLGGFLHLHHGKITVSVTTLITSDFASATTLITFGCMLGKLSPVQMVVMAVIETTLFMVNEHIGLKLFKVADVGGSMFVHAFGAYFGLALSRVLYDQRVEAKEQRHKEGSSYHSDVFAMIGTIFLWMFWPSFNSALAPADQRYRAVINTYYAMAACCVMAYAVSSLVNKESKLDMVHIQNSTLAGGVAVGTSADMMIHPWGAMVIGSVAGVLSVLGYTYITPWLHKKMKIHDTCGVNNLHGMPGVMAGICGAVTAGIASLDTYHYSLYNVFPARAPTHNSSEYIEVQQMMSEQLQAELTPGDGRSGMLQAGFQLLALAVSLVIAVMGGTITGFILRWPVLEPLEQRQIFDDTDYWELEAGSGDESEAKDLMSGGGAERNGGAERDGAAATDTTKV